MENERDHESFTDKFSSLDDLVHSNYDRTPEELVFSAKVCAWCIVLGILTLIAAWAIG